MGCNKDCRQDFSRHASNRIVVQRQVLVADLYGGQDNTWTTAGTYWAWIKPVSTYEQVQNQMLQAGAGHKFIIRFNSALKDIKVTASYRITFDSRVFNIKGIKNFDIDLSSYGNSFQEILAEENGAEKA